MVCGKCSRENPNDAPRCVYCGEPFAGGYVPQYEPPVYNASDYVYDVKPDDSDDLVSMGTWLLILFGGSVPLVNLVLWIYLMVGARRPSLRGYGKGMLILTAVVVGIIVLIMLIMMIFFAQVFAAIMSGITIEQ